MLALTPNIYGYRWNNAVALLIEEWKNEGGMSILFGRWWHISRKIMNRRIHSLNGNGRTSKKQKVAKRYLQKSLESCFLGETVCISPKRVSKKLRMAHNAILTDRTVGTINKSPELPDPMSTDSQKLQKSNKTTPTRSSISYTIQPQSSSIPDMTPGTN